MWLGPGGRYETEVNNHLLACTSARQFQGTGERVQTWQEPEREFFVSAVRGAAAKDTQVGAGPIVFGIDRDGVPLAVAVLAVIPPSGRRAQIQTPAAGHGDQAVDPNGQAVNRRQGGADVKVTPRAVGPLRRIEHARPVAGQAAGRAMLGQYDTQLPQLVRKLAGGVKLARSLNLGDPGQRSRAMLPEDVLCDLGAGEMQLHQPGSLVRQLALGRAHRYRSELADPHGRAARAWQAGRGLVLAA